MTADGEILTLFLGAIALFYVIASLKRLLRLPGAPVLLAAFLLLFPAWIATLFDGGEAGNIFDLLEHLFFALTSIALMGWVILALREESRNLP